MKNKKELTKTMLNRIFVGFIVVSVICVLLTISIFILLPLKTYIPILIHQNKTTGDVWVTHPKTPFTPINDAQIKSDIVRYLSTRESYDAADLNERFHLVMLLSNNSVSKEYVTEQSNQMPASPVNTLGKEGMRRVSIQDIVFIDREGIEEFRHFREKSHNLAKVDFTVTETKDSTKKIQSFVATIGWEYRGTPQDSQEAFDNWSGFTVTTYRVDSKNVEAQTKS